MKDFTIRTHTELLINLRRQGYNFQRVEDFVLSPMDKVVILRHDVDSWPSNALQMARIEADKGISATYYFRSSRLSFNERILKEIIKLGHEIGYHYEDLARSNGNPHEAIASFKKNLDFYRQYYPVKTVAMHGRPLSPWDSKDIWKYYDYRNYGVIAEPYLDIDFNKVGYLTDTGNCWDGDKFSVRDHVISPFKFNIHSTFDLIENIKGGALPDIMMLNIHPARWNDNLIKWWIRYYILTLPKFKAKQMLKQRRNKQR